MKVSELAGVELDILVAQAEGFEPYRDKKHPLPPRTHMLLWQNKNGEHFHFPPPKFSETWMRGGPIIERERIAVFPMDGEGHFIGDAVSGPRWLARCDGQSCNQIGKTPLEAAMRAYVEAKFGVEVPSNAS